MSDDQRESMRNLYRRLDGLEANLTSACERIEAKLAADTENNYAVRLFLKNVENETKSAIEKFPQPNPTIAALTEEVGELAKALLHIREGKSNDWSRVYDEAVQVAAMALRAALEGDPTIGAVPDKETEGSA